jgi:hypothetical protein
MCTFKQLHVSPGRPPSLKPKQVNRRGAIAVLAVVFLIILLSFAAFAVDLGILTVARTELQRTADAAALAGGGALMSENRLKGEDYAAAVVAQARETVADYCQKNPAFNAVPTINTNADSQDLKIGRFYYPHNIDSAVSPSEANAILVRVHRTGIPLFFGRIFGASDTQCSAEAIATFRDGIVGFRAPRDGETNSLMPFAVKLEYWNAVVARLAGTDNYRVNPKTGAVSLGADGIKELVMFPDRNQGQGIVPGNFGTVDIGDYGNSTADLKRQIKYGVSAEDLDRYGGELKLGIDGKLNLNGDTGVSAGMELSVESTIGKGPRTILIYSDVYNPGNTAQFVIVDFGGIRVLACNFHGVHKFVLVQPAVVNDSTAISEDGDKNYTVYQPVQLVH